MTADRAQLPPIRRLDRRWTFHEDGTASYFDHQLGRWDRGNPQAYLDKLKAARIAKPAKWWARFLSKR